MLCTDESSPLNRNVATIQQVSAPHAVKRLDHLDAYLHGSVKASGSDGHENDGRYVSALCGTVACGLPQLTLRLHEADH